MKTYKVIAVIAIVVLGAFISACNKESNHVKDLTNEIVGTYNGTLTINGLKTKSNATAVITKKGDNEIQIYCHGDEIDTTITQRLFENGNMLEMCNVGDDFYHEYGHEMMNQSQHHNMMNSDEGTSWSHHLAEEHSDGDMHYGHFDRKSHSFEYTYMMQNNGTLSKAMFYGAKK